MRLERVQKLLKERNYQFDYMEEDGCGSINFVDRGLEYHIWEFPDDDGNPCGVETNLMHCGHMEDITGEDYEDQLLKTLDIFDNRTGM